MRNNALLSALLAVIAASWLAGAEVRQCVKGGCSNHRCFALDTKEDMPATTCEWTPAYGCYEKFGTCEWKPGGPCDFVMTPELEACLKDPARFGFTL
jgi:hypothetical protein